MMLPASPPTYLPGKAASEISEDDEPVAKKRFQKKEKKEKRKRQKKERDPLVDALPAAQSDLRVTQDIGLFGKEVRDLLDRVEQHNLIGEFTLLVHLLEVDRAGHTDNIRAVDVCFVELLKWSLRIYKHMRSAPIIVACTGVCVRRLVAVIGL